MDFIPENKIGVLVVGKDGRAHALAWKLMQSARLGRLYAAPGNPGISEIAECVPISELDIPALLEFAQDKQIKLVVVSSETPLAAGIVDVFEAAGIMIVGPTKAAAELEWSKGFALELMRDHGIPTAEFCITLHLQEALEAAKLFLKRDGRVYMKFDGLAGGKGAEECTTLKQAKAVIEKILVERVYGDPGRGVVVMAHLGDGEEASIFALTDGEDAVLLAPSQDHKRIFEGDRGKNTGGMGAYAPAPVITTAVMEDIKARIVMPTLRAMKQAGRPYRGVLYVGVIMTATGPRVVEFNCRLGDPETQAVLAVLEADLLELFLAVCTGRIGEMHIPPPRLAAVCVVLAVEGYPGKYKKGIPIYGLENAQGTGAFVFHAGTASDGEGLVTDGGRVVGVTALQATIPRAIAHVYEAVQHIDFIDEETGDSMLYCRDDIGHRALKHFA